MKVRNAWDQLALVAIIAVGCWDCTVTSGTADAAAATCTTAAVCEGVTAGPPPPQGATKGPCDIYAEDGGPCVAAHSTVRALYGGYNGPLYQVRSAANATRDIGPTV